MRDSIPDLFRVPFPYLFSNYILRTPCIGTLFLIFYIYTCLPAGTSSGLFAAISIGLSLISFFSTLPMSFGTPIAFVVSLFFVSDFDEFYVTVYAVVSVIALVMFVLHYVVMHRLSTKRYLTLPSSGRVIVNPDWVEKQLFCSQPDRKNNTVLSLLAPVVLVLLLAGALFGSSFISGNNVPFVPNTPTPRAAPTKNVTATPRLNLSSITNVVIPSPKPTETLNPHPMYNGRIVVSTSYERVCPLTVHAGSGSGYYYVFLDYACPPISTTEYRKVMKHASPPYEADIAFLVKAGQSVSIDVPIGVYKFYYATGSTFYGPKYLFGDSTHCYKADDLLTFNATSNYYNGHTITLYATVGGNFDTDDIPDSQFPTK